MTRLLTALRYAAMAIMIVSLPMSASGDTRERDYQARWCRAHAGVMEFRLDDGARVDCVTATHAAEVEFAPKWAEAVGQSLYYAAQTGLEPGIVLIMGTDDQRYYDRLIAATRRCRITIWQVSK
ncbi:MAG: hypothetical protein OHK006_13020 [Thermodesulfovibrionales bacterium]